MYLYLCIYIYIYTFCIDTARRLPPRHVCGVLATRWEFLHTLPESYSWLQRAALKQSKDAQKVHGFLQYPVAHFAKLVEPMAYRSLEQAVHDIQFLMAMEYNRGTSSYSQEAPLDTFVQAWEQIHSLRRFSCMTLQCSQSLGAALLPGQDTCHAVVVSSKVNRKNLLIHSDPSQKLLGKLRGLHQPATSEQPHAVRRKSQQTASQMLQYTFLHQADMRIEWLDASKYVKSFGYMWAASKSFARIFAKYNGKSPASVLGETAKINAETLRQARNRLDIVCMNLFRKVWRLLSSSVYRRRR